GLRADEAQHARLERADPDLDVVRGRGTALGAVDVVVRTARDETLARRRVPQTPDHVDALGEGVDRLAGREALAAHRDDRVPEAARAETELDAPAGEAVEARDGPREHGRRAQRQVERSEERRVGKG